MENIDKYFDDCINIYCESNKRNYVRLDRLRVNNISLLYKIAEKFSYWYDVPIETIHLEHRSVSSLIYSTEENQKPFEGYFKRTVVIDNEADLSLYS